jgi:hypothetical protein
MNDMPFYEKGDVRIRYEEAGSGFPRRARAEHAIEQRLAAFGNNS